jgi:hypothetical protein
MRKMRIGRDAMVDEVSAMTDIIKRLQDAGVMKAALAALKETT